LLDVLRSVGQAVLDIDSPAFHHAPVEIQVNPARTPDIPPGLLLADEPLFRQLGGSRAGQGSDGGGKDDNGELRSHGALPLGCGERTNHEAGS
jgi:hypothetical protein